VIGSSDLEEDGISIEALEIELHKGLRPILFYLIPDFQNPTGSVMSLAKRHRLLDLADQYGFLVVEDAPYRTLRYSGNELPSLFDLNPAKVLQMSSFSKLISPGLRVGYAILPPAIAAQVIEFAGDTYINAPFLNQAMVYRFIQKGWLDPHLAELKKLYSQRLDSLLAALDEQLKNKGIWNHPQGGFFIGFTTHQDLEIAELLKKAERIGLQLSDGRGFFVQGGQNFIRLPFIFEGMLYGILAVLLSFLMLGLLGNTIRFEESNLLTYYSNLQLDRVFAAELIITTVLAVISSFSAVQQYLKGKLTVN